MDSETPSYQPLSYIIATTLTTIPETQPIDMMLWVKFCVAIKRIINANSIAMKIPCMAPATKAYSLGINFQPLLI